MNKLNYLTITLVIMVATVQPALQMSRWFSSSFHDLRITLKRYGYCISDLPPLKDSNYNETDYLVNQVKTFLDQGNYDNEQLANMTALMNDICRSGPEQTYPISVGIDVNKYSNATGKENRCRAIDESLNAMFYVFRRASLNRSEPLDFSTIKFYPNSTDKTLWYNLTDLINTSWIKSDTLLDHVCKITDSVREYVQNTTSKSISQDRSQQGGANYLASVVEFLDRLLEPIIGLQRRLYWDGSNRLEIIYSNVGNGLGSIRTGVGNGLKGVRSRITNIFTHGSSSNSTSLFNSTNSTSTNANKTNSTLPKDRK